MLPGFSVDTETNVFKCKCYISLNNPEALAELLVKLSFEGGDCLLIAI